MRRSSPSTSTWPTTPRRPPGTCGRAAGPAGCSPSTRPPTCSSAPSSWSRPTTPGCSSTSSRPHRTVLDRQGDRAAQAATLRRMAELCDRLDDPACTVTTLLGREPPGLRGQRVRRRRRPRDPGRQTSLAQSGLDDRVAEGHLWSGKALTWHGRGASRPRPSSTPRSRSLGPRGRRRSWPSRCGTSPCWPATRAGSPTRWSFGAQAREEFAKDGDLEAESTALAQHAVTLFNLGRVDESRDLFEQALPVFMASGHLYRQAVVLGNLASSSFLLGDLSAAERWCRQAIERADTLADVEAGATDRTILGLIELWTDRWPAARGELRVRPGGPAWRSAAASSRWTRRPGSASACWSTASRPKRRVDARPGRRRGRHRRDRRPAERRARAVGSWLRPAGHRRRRPPRRGGRRRAPGGRGASGERGRDGVPQCDALRLAIARCGGLDPSAAADGCRRDRGSARPAGGRRVDAPADLLGELWDALAGGGPGHEAGAQQLREPSPGPTWTGASWARRNRRRRPASSRCRRSPAWSSYSTRPDVELHLGLSGGGDLTARLYRELREAIRDGRLRPGDRLPPTRELATPARAGARYRRHGIRAARRRGLPRRPRRRRHLRRRRRAAAGVRAVAGGRVRCDLVGAGPRPPRPCRPAVPLPYDFSVGVPDPALFPFDTWRRLVTSELRAGANAPGRYGDPAGLPGLREAVSRYVGVSRAVLCDPEDVLVTNGTQHALDLVSRVAPRTRRHRRRRGPRVPAGRNAVRGIRYARGAGPGGREGARRRARSRLVRGWSTSRPSHQFPSGAAMSLRRRVALVEWAQEHDALVVEDDYDSEFRFSSRPLEPLVNLDPSGRVCYVGSFSKTMLPALRLGFIVAPPSLRLALRAARQLSDGFSPVPTQAALARFIDDGMLARHVRKASSVYAARHAAVLAALESVPGVQLVPSSAGLHVCARLPGARPGDGRRVVAAARRLGVAVESLDGYYLGQQGSTSAATAVEGGRGRGIRRRGRRPAGRGAASARTRPASRDDRLVADRGGGDRQGPEGVAPVDEEQRHDAREGHDGPAPGPRPARQQPDRRGGTDDVDDGERAGREEDRRRQVQVEHRRREE